MKDIKVKTLYEGFGDKKKSYNMLIKTDMKRLQQVLLNLVANAVKFTDRNGKIVIKVNLKPNKLKIEVIDTGIGIK